MGPTETHNDRPWTILAASDGIDVWQKSRDRQNDTILAAMFNSKFKNLCLVGARRVYFWECNTGVLNKTYDSKYGCESSSLVVVARHGRGR